MLSKKEKIASLPEKIPKNCWLWFESQLYFVYGLYGYIFWVHKEIIESYAILLKKKTIILRNGRVCKSMLNLF